MKKLGLYLALVAMVGFLAAPAWAGPQALTDDAMDGVFAQGIVIQNNFSDDDSFDNSQSQANMNYGKNYQGTDPTAGASNTGSASGGNAYDAAAQGVGGDAGSIARGGAWGGNASNATDSTGTGGDSIGGGSTAGSGTATSTGGDSDGGTGAAIPVAVALAGDGDAEAENEAGDGYNGGLALGVSLGVNLGVNYFDNENRAESTQYSEADVDQDLTIDEAAIASDYSVAFQNVGGEYFQSQTNGTNAFNNSQNQLYGEATSNGPTISTEVNTDSYSETYAQGYAEAAPADAQAYNDNNTTQTAVAVSAAADLGLSAAGTLNGAYAQGGDNGQGVESEAGNLGFAAAGNDAYSTALGLGLGLSNAGSESGDATGGDAASTATATAGGTDTNPGNAGAIAGAAGGDAASASAGGQSYAPFDQNAQTGEIGQTAAAQSAQDAQSGDAAGVQDSKAAAGATAYTAALLDQDANAEKADADVENDNDQDAKAYAKSSAYNATQAATYGNSTISAVEQINVVKSVYVAGGQNDNTGNILNGAQGAISAQQVNAVPINSTDFSGPVNMGNAIATNGVFN